MALENAQILRRDDGLYLEVTDPRGRHAAVCLDWLLRRDYGSDTEAVVLAWAESQVQRTEIPEWIKSTR